MFRKSTGQRLFLPGIHYNRAKPGCCDVVVDTVRICGHIVQEGRLAGFVELQANVQEGVRRDHDTTPVVAAYVLARAVIGYGLSRTTKEKPNGEDNRVTESSPIASGS